MPYKLTSDTKKHLRELAAALQPDGPKLPSPPQMLTAEQMTARLGITHDADGLPLRAGELYLAKDAPAVNHLRRLELAYYHGGERGVEKYLEPFKGPGARLRELQAAA